MKKEKDEDRGPEIMCRFETGNDATNLLQTLLMVRSIAFMSKKFVETLKLEEGYYELTEAFDTIKMLIEPVMSFFCDDAPALLKSTKRRPHSV